MKKLKIINVLSFLFLISPMAISSAHHHSNEDVKKENNIENKKEIQVVKNDNSNNKQKQKQSLNLSQNGEGK